MNSKKFELILPENSSGNAIDRIGNQWFLITAGNKKLFNTMTAAWGALGYLWYKPAAFIFVRPTRFTFQFLETYEYFTMSFFDKKFKDILNFCGTKSGKHIDKIKETGLIPCETQLGNIYFEQANLVYECKKLYFTDLQSGTFIDTSIDKKVYVAKDYHRLFVGEIVNCWQEVVS